MISFNSFKKFFYINGLLITIGVFEYNITNYSTNLYINSFTILPVFISRNYFLINLFDNNSNNKDNIHNDIIVENYENEFKINLLTSTIVETTSFIFIKHFILYNSLINYLNDLLIFIPISFIFELIFDFFHYWTHRLLHNNSFLYINIHKKHHKYTNPILILAFYQDPLDLILTNSIPQILTLLIFPYISLFQFNIILIYKSFTEISGHTNKKVYPLVSFPQFIWLPNFFKFALYREDHNLHHSKNNCNYSKRFSFWDKLFGTYKTNN